MYSALTFINVLNDPLKDVWLQILHVHDGSILFFEPTIEESLEKTGVGREDHTVCQKFPMAYPHRDVAVPALAQQRCHLLAARVDRVYRARVCMYSCV